MIAYKETKKGNSIKMMKCEECGRFYDIKSKIAHLKTKRHIYKNHFKKDLVIINKTIDISFNL